jgi:hypothetical protein
VSVVVSCTVAWDVVCPVKCLVLDCRNVCRGYKYTLPC